MKRPAQTSQGGSVATFLIVGVVLAVLLVGGIYTVQKRTQSSITATPVVQTAAPTTTSSPKPAPTSPPATSVPTKTPKAAKLSPTPSAQKTGPQVAKNQNGLPVTGPTDNFFTTVMLASLAGVIVAFVQSLRERYNFSAQLD